MAVNFSVQFIINETTQTRVIRLTDTSSGFTFGKSLFSVYFPDGSSRVKTDYTSPDITVSGGYIDIVPVLSNNTFITGEYRIVCTAIDSSAVEQTPLQRTFDFNWVKPSNGITNGSDVIIPEVKFTDTNSYTTIGSFTGVFTRVLSVAMPSTSAVSGTTVINNSTATLDAIVSSNYYEGVYVPTSTISGLYTHSSYSWLTVQYDEIFSRTYDIRKTPDELDLLIKINNFRAQIEAYEGVNDTQFQALNYKYERVISLYTHIIKRYDSLTKDGSQGQLNELLSILEPYSTGTYTYQSTPIAEFTLATSIASSFIVSDGTSTTIIQLLETLTFISSVTGLEFSVGNNSLTLGTTTGYSVPTDAKQTQWDSAYNDKIVSADVSGITTKTLTLTQQDGGVVTASWSDYSPVVSVFGRTGAVVASSGDYTTSQVTEGTNLYYTQGRFDTAFGLKSTTDLSEGTNLYYTDARFDSRLATKTTTNLSEGINLYYTQGRFDTAFASKSTTNLSEGTNLYYTNARARAAISESITGIDYNSTTGVFSITTGYAIPTTSKQTQWDVAYNARISTFTTTGNSGAATFSLNALNIPNYTLSGLGGEPAITAGTTAQYWRGDKSFQTLDTTAVVEGTNLYYTDGRFDTRLATKTTDNLTEGLSNLYFTAARVRATDLTGLNITGSAIVAGDTIIQALGKIQNQINGLVGSVIYQGTWDASLNSPSLISATGTKGYYYKVSVAGSTNLDGITDWKVGDWVIYNGSAWEKVDNTDSVSSVNGYSGAVSLVTTDITEGTNLYYTTTRFDDRLATKTTDNLSEGTTNLYYTDARVRAAVVNSNNYLPKSNGTTFVNSIITDNTSYIYINGYLQINNTKLWTGASNGSSNIGIGYNTLDSLFSSNSNIGIGDLSLRYTTTGGGNVAVGVNALNANTTGAENVAIGSNAYLYSQTGGRNIAIGVAAGGTNSDSTAHTDGSNSIYIGSYLQASANGVTNEIVIGYSAIGNGSNTATYGNSNIASHIFTAGNVGIGVVPSGYKLDVNGTGRFSGGTAQTLVLDTTFANGLYTVYRNNGADRFYIGERGVVSGNGGSGYDLYSASGYDIRFFSGGSKILTLNNDASATFSSDVTTGGDLYVNGNSVIGNSNAGITNAGTTRLTLQNTSLANSRGIGFYANDGTQNPRSWIKHITASGSQYVEFSSDYSTASSLSNWIFASGNVTINEKLGVGMSPSYKLDVNGNARFSPYLPIVLSGVGSPYWGPNITFAGDLGSTQGGARIQSRYDGTGGVGMWFERSTNSQSYNQDPTALTYTPSMQISGNGNVTINEKLGIGVTPSTYKLDVNGTGRFSGVLDVFVSGNNTRLANLSTSTYGSSRGLRINSYISSGGGDDCAIEFDSGVAGYGGFKFSNSGTPNLTIDQSGAATFSSSVTAGGYINSQASSINSNGGMFLLSNNYTYFSGKSTGNGAVLSNGDGTATVKAFSPNGSNGYLGFETGNGTNRMTINSSGNVTINEKLGIGTTNTSSKVNIGGDAATNGLSIKSGGNVGTYPFRVTWTGGTEGDAFCIDDNLRVGIGTSSPSSILDIRQTNLPRITLVKNGIISWYIGNPTQSTSNYFSIGTDSGGNTNIFNITNSGEVAIGTTSPERRLHVSGGGYKLFGSVGLFSSSYTSDGLYGSTSLPNFISTNGYSGTYGRFGGETGLVLGYADTGLGLYSPAYSFEVKSVDGRPVGGIVIRSIIVHDVDTNQEKLIIYNNGNIENTNNSYSGISDIRLKENIVDSTPKLESLMKVKIRNYNFIGDDLKQIGVIAQELEEIFPSMIHNDYKYDENGIIPNSETKSVKYSIFVPMLIKAMQEQQAQIESLKAELDALKN